MSSSLNRNIRICTKANDIMKRTFLLILGLVILSLTMQSFISAPQEDGDGELSPLVGTWDWKEGYEIGSHFAIWVGERNDSLIFTMGGSFFYGQKLHSAETTYDEERMFIQMICVKKPEGNFVKTKISEGISNGSYNYDRRNLYNDISFEVLNDSTMLFILGDKRSYWPDTARMIRRDRVNHEFSDETYLFMYKGE